MKRNWSTWVKFLFFLRYYNIIPLDRELNMLHYLWWFGSKFRLVIIIITILLCVLTSFILASIFINNIIPIIWIAGIFCLILSLIKLKDFGEMESVKTAWENNSNLRKIKKKIYRRMHLLRIIKRSKKRKKEE